MRRFAKSRMAARLQMMVSERQLSSGLYSEIASHLPLKDGVKILDIGSTLFPVLMRSTEY